MIKYQKGEIATFISIITLIGITFFSLFSTKLISQKQTSTTKAQECSCGCAYTETQCTGGYSYVAIAWDEYDTPTQYDYVCQGWEDVCTTCNQCPEQEPVNYDSESSSSESTNYDWESSSSESEYDQTCQCQGGYWNDFCDNRGESCNQEQQNNQTCECVNGYWNDFCDNRYSSCNPNDNPDNQNQSCSRGTCLTDADAGYCTGDYEEAGACMQGGYNGVCCAEKGSNNQNNQESSCSRGNCITESGGCVNGYEETGYCTESGYNGVCCAEISSSSSLDSDGQCNEGSCSTDGCSEDQDEKGICSLNGTNGVCCSQKQQDLQKKCEDLGGECVSSYETNENTNYMSDGQCDNGMVCVNKSSQKDNKSCEDSEAKCTTESGSCSDEESNVGSCVENNQDGVCCKKKTSNENNVEINGEKTKSYSFDGGTINMNNVPDSYTNDNPAIVTVTVDGEGVTTVSMPDDVDGSISFNDYYEEQGGNSESTSFDLN